MSSSTSLPREMKALVLPEPGGKLALQTIPVPAAIPGSVVVKVIANLIDPNTPDSLSGNFLSFPKNLIPGTRAIARIAATSQDTTSLVPGQLVMLEPWIRARDDPNVQILWGLYDGPTPTSKKFMADNWTHGTWSEYVRAPLENCYPLNEEILFKKLGYDPASLLQLGPLSVAYGGLRSMGVTAGETVVIAPATGSFSGAGVQVAVAMGARVIAMSRDVEKLKRLQALYPPGRVEIVQNTGNVDADTAALRAFGDIDAYLDISPATAAKSTHVRSCFQAIRQYGRACLMGVLSNDIEIPYMLAVFNNLTIRGQYMYERDDVRNLIKLAESGVLPLGKEGGVEVVASFKLEEFEQAIEAAVKHPETGKLVVMRS